jgi:predicted DNA-binding transcriptional regulator YafY
MKQKENKITKTERILAIYHLFIYCEEVSMQELSDNLPGCKKTFSRDIALLKESGIPICYSSKRRAFVLGSDKRVEPCFPENKSELRYIKKLMRLTKMMNEMDSADEPDKWYAETFPDASKRTMERDFAVLNAIGYKIRYKRSEDDNVGEWDSPLGRYYCDFPYSTYELEIFYNKI